MIPQRSTTTTMSYATSSPTIAGLADADAEKHGRIARLFHTWVSCIYRAYSTSPTGFMCQRL